MGCTADNHVVLHCGGTGGRSDSCIRNTFKIKGNIVGVSQEWDSDLPLAKAVGLKSFLMKIRGNISIQIDIKWLCVSPQRDWFILISALISKELFWCHSPSLNFLPLCRYKNTLYLPPTSASTFLLSLPLKSWRSLLGWITWFPKARLWTLFLLHVSNPDLTSFTRKHQDQTMSELASQTRKPNPIQRAESYHKISS